MTICAFTDEKSCRLQGILLQEPHLCTACWVTDEDLMRKEHRFLRTAEDDAELTYEKRLAKKYYDKLFKEYAIADLRLYKEGKVGLRWRTEQEVIEGKGQFICGGKGCTTAAHLTSFEVHFAYLEAGEKKAALVKVRLCPPCGEKLNYKRNKEKRKEEKRAAKRRREEAGAEQDSGRKKAAAETTEEGAQEELGAAGDEVAAAEEIECVENEEKRKEKQQREKEKSEAKAALAAKEAAVWQQKPTMEKTKEEEFDEYFRDLFP